MKREFSEQFNKSYKAAPLDVQKSLDKQLRFLLSNLRHPSLRAKKFDETLSLWQARVTRGWRFLFKEIFIPSAPVWYQYTNSEGHKNDDCCLVGYLEPTL